jgi:hypothetical protein
MAKRIILGTVLTLALTLSANLVQAVTPKNNSSLGAVTPVLGATAIYLETNSKERFFRSPGDSEPLPLMKTDPERDGRYWLEPLSPPNPEARLPHFTSPFNNLSPLSTRLYNRLEPGNLSDLLLRRACGYLDTPYRRGGSLQSGHATDCSGFVQYIYKKSNIDLPRASAEQAQVGKVAARTMDFSKLMAGDLLFFRRDGRHIGHVGIYAGEGKMIHASSRRRGVIITDLRQSYYQDTFVVAKRLLEVKPAR